MSTATETKPEVSTTDGTEDDRLRHFVERLTPKGYVPPRFSNVALCGAKVTNFVDHNGTICQACVDEQRRRPPE